MIVWEVQGVVAIDNELPRYTLIRELENQRDDGAFQMNKIDIAVLAEALVW